MLHKWMVLLLFSFGAIVSYSQQTIDSLREQVNVAVHDTAKSKLLLRLAQLTIHSQPDTALSYAYEALRLSEKNNFNRVKIYARINIAMVLGFSGNYVKALELLFEALSIAEQENNKEAISLVNHVLGNVYRWQKDYDKSTYYYLKVMANAESSSRKPHEFYLTECNLAEVYYETNKIDSALMYGQRAYEHVLASRSKFSFYIILTRLGLIHQKMGNQMLGRQYLLMAEAKVMPTNEIRNKCFFLLDMSTFFEQAGHIDSSIYYAKYIFSLPGSHIFKPQLLDATEQLAKLYTGNNNDSAFRYLHMSLALKEELLGQKQQQQIQTMQFEEILRQQKVATEAERLANERKQNLQYAAIALALISFAIVLIVLSHSILANQRLIKFLGILSLLMVFEFLNLLLHPILGTITHHQPIWMLSAMVCIAALLIPLHHKLEHWITHKMVEKNNRIRLAAAKKTIEHLQGNVQSVTVKKKEDTEEQV